MKHCTRVKMFKNLIFVSKLKLFEKWMCNTNIPIWIFAPKFYQKCELYASIQDTIHVKCRTENWIEIIEKSEKLTKYFEFSRPKYLHYFFGLRWSMSSRTSRPTSIQLRSTFRWKLKQNINTKIRKKLKAKISKIAKT